MQYYTVKPSSAGGYFGPELKRAGYDVVIVEGKSSEPLYVLITEQKVEFKRAGDYWGMWTAETQVALKRELGDEQVRVACIGPAGESLVPFAAIISEQRAAARGGAGAVMGSKNLKAIAVRGHGRVAVSRPEEFRRVVREAIGKIREDPVTGQTLPFYGSAGAGLLYNEAGVVPFKNWREAHRPEGTWIFGDSLRSYVTRDCFCAPPCPVKCTKTVQLSQQGQREAEGPEYETLYAFGASCGVYDLNSILQANWLCDELGMDTISAGLSLAFVMECFERGLVPSGDAGAWKSGLGRESLFLCCWKIWLTDGGLEQSWP